MKTKKKTILQSIPLGVKLLTVFIILSIATAMMGESGISVEALESGLWVFVRIVGISAVVLVLIALVISDRNKKRKVMRNERSEDEDSHEDEEAEEAPAPAAPHPPAPADGHGHDSHGGASGALPWLLLALVLGLLALVYVGKKAGFGVIPGVGGYGRDAGAHAPADYSSHQDGVSLDWNPVTAPMSGWLTLNGKAGYDIIVCVPTTNPSCAVDVPVIGFRMRCVLMDGVTEVDWDTSGSCRDYLRLKLQSTGNKRLPMNYRYVRRR